MINKWKDERLKKLEDFTKELLSSGCTSNRASTKKTEQMV